MKAARWLGAIVLVWALAVGLAAYVSSRRDEPTAREQTSVGDARPAVNRAVTRLVSAAGPDAVVVVSPFIKVGTCRISLGRGGEQWEQALEFHTRPGGESALLDRLGAAYGQRPSSRGALRIDAGGFVSVSGGFTPGEVRLTAATGCRTGTVDAGVGVPDQASRAPVEAAMSALGVRAATWTGYAVPCPDGGELRVVSATSESGASPGPLPSTLMSVGPDAVVSTAEVYAYRTGTTSVVARLHNGVMAVTATKPCG